MKLISIVTPCYNEEQNIKDVYNRVKDVFAKLEGYNHEHIFIDNASTDLTVDILKEIANEDKDVKIIVNTRNFGHVRSPYYGILQAKGDAVIGIVADLQDPPELILDFIKKWEQGFKVVLGVKSKSEENFLMFHIRKAYYNFVNSVSEIRLTKNCTGFGLYDKEIIEILKKINDPYPYFRGLINDIGFESFEIEYTQRTRKRGITKNNFYTLYDIAMLGITNHSKVPLRFAIFFGFTISIMSLFVALFYFIMKLLYWDNFVLGLAPLTIGLFFFSSIHLIFIGILGEYIGAIHTKVQNRPLVIEKERVNF